MVKKVYEVMEQFSDLQFIVFGSDSTLLFVGYKAVCQSCCLNLWVEQFGKCANNTVVIYVY